MASWEDGPEYAPIERPDGFSVPYAAPLSVAEPYVQPAADAPIVRARLRHPAGSRHRRWPISCPCRTSSAIPTRPYDVA